MGPITHLPVEFNVYTPPGYADNPTERYPVLYHLHGRDESYGAHNEEEILSLEKAMRAGVMVPMFIVFPDGMTDSFYADSKDGKKPVETQIIRELIPYIDSTFRTLAHPRYRAVMGFSMGGFGAMEYTAKFPNLFSIGVSNDGGLRNWDTMEPQFRASIFGDDQAYWNLYSPWENARANQAALRQTGALRVIGSEYFEFAGQYSDLLTSLMIPVSHVDVTCPGDPHDSACVDAMVGQQTWDFIYKAMAMPRGN